MDTTNYPWPVNDAERVLFVDWQYAVDNGETALGFRAWVEGEGDDDE